MSIRRAWLAIGVIAVHVSTGLAQPEKQPPRPDTERRGMLAQAAFQTSVPDHPYDVLLTPPQDNSIGVSLRARADSEVVIEYGGQSLSRRTPPATLKAGEATLVTLKDLTPGAEHRYRVLWKERGAKEFTAGQEQRFHLPRRKGEGFTFTIQADSHLDGNMSTAAYEQALRLAIDQHPDFHVDLGDTFMTDKRRAYQDALPQYHAQRYYLGLIGSSAPVFMVLGNHDGESGFAAPMRAWSYQQRTTLFPPPAVEGVYTGDTTRANSYAWTWGDALFVVLDPFSATTRKARGRESEVDLTDESWNLTLGREQYDWLARTLRGSRARYRFVFTHHLVGGRGKAARGGVEAAPFFEWGGRNSDGSAGFAEHRPGWEKPIHDLLVETHVNAVFHGHDHLYVHAERDGVTYQCVPQPGNLRGGTQSAREYGYVEGTVRGGPGILRITVNAAAAEVAYLRVPGGRGGSEEPMLVYNLQPLEASKVGPPAERPPVPPR